MAGAPGPVAADGKTVGFVTQALDVIQNRVARFEHEAGLVRHVKMLASGIPVRPLGHSDHGNVINSEVSQNTHGRKLALPAIDQHQVGPGGFSAILHRLASSFRSREKRRVSTSFIMPKSSP